MRRAPDILIRVIFELHFRSKDRVTEIQNRIRAFSANPFHTVMAEGLSWITKDRLLVFERVEFDLGEVRISRLEDDLAAAIAKGLRRWAFAVKPTSSWPLPLSPRNTTDGGRDGWYSQHPVRQSECELAPAYSAGGLNAAIAMALQKSGDWQEFLAAIRHNHALRCRLADEVSPKLLRRLVIVLAPQEGVRIADSAETLLRLHERQPLLAANIHVFKRGLWECILAELAGPPPTNLNPRSFMTCVVRRLAARYSFSHLGIAANLALALRRHSTKTTVTESLAVVVAELNRGGAHDGVDSSLDVASTTVAPADITASTITRRLDDLATFLELSLLPWSLIGRGAEAELLDLLAAVPDELCALVRKLSEKESVRKRIAGQLSETAKSRLLLVLAPTAGSWMISYLQHLRRLHAQKPFFPAQNRHYAEELWELSFEYLALHQQQTFDPRTFLRYLLMQLASRRKRSYEYLLSGLLLRRGPESWVSRPGNASQDASLGHTLLALLDQVLLEPAGLGVQASHFLIAPGSRHYYSDLDVLAHWLRWQKLPRWSHATDPEETGWRLGSLLHGLPRDVQVYATRITTRDMTAPGPDRTETVAFAGADQIKHWLAFGLWPDAVSGPDSSQLGTWLESRSDADWLKALKDRGAHEAMIARLSHHLSPSLFERIARLLSGHAAGQVLAYIRCLDLAGRHIAPVATQLWGHQLKKYTLMSLLRASSMSDRHVISVSELARSTMLALALSCRVSYERLLDAVEEENHGQDGVQSLCSGLRQELEAQQNNIAAIDPTCISAEEPDVAAPLGCFDLVLHYLKHGFVPESAAGTSFAALQRVAEDLSGDQVSSLGQACSAETVKSREGARRAAALFSTRNFVHFVHPLLSYTGVASELEDAIAALAPRLSAPVKPLLVEARVFLLRRPAPPRPGTADVTFMNSLLSGLIPEIVNFTGARHDLVRRELESIVPALAEHERDSVFRHPNFSPVSCQSGTRAAAAYAVAPHSAAEATTINSTPQPAAPDQGLHGTEGEFATRKQKPRAALTTEVSRQIRDAENTLAKTDKPVGSDSVVALSTDDLPGKVAALGKFLRTGQLPWWGETLTRESSRRWFTSCLSGDSASSLKTLRSACTAHPAALQRLMRYIASTELEQIVHAAAPEYGGLLLRYIYVGSLLSTAGAAPPAIASPSRTGAMHWQQTLALLLDERWPTPSPAQALRELTARVSRSLSMTRDSYIARMLPIARRWSTEGSGYTALADMLEQIAPSLSPDAAQSAMIAHMAELAPVADADENSDKTSFLETTVGLPSASDALQQLDYLLRYGELPERAENGDQAAFTAQIAEDMNKRPIEYRRYLLQAAGRVPERMRMARLLPTSLLARVWPLLSPTHHTHASLCLGMLEETLSVSSTGNLGKSCREIVVEQLFQAMSSLHGRRWDGAAYIRSTIERLAGHLSLRPAVLVKRIRATLDGKADGLQKKLGPLIDRVELETAAIPPLVRVLARPPQRSKPRSHQPAKASRQMPQGEPFYIKNSGVVLLWPFLQQYFQRLGLLEKNGFRSEQFQTRAIYLLQYLATGILNAPEHQLLLNKTLAGVGVEQPLEYPAPIIESEEALSEQVLQGVLQNWEKLKNTSIQGLRASFLMREGKLLFKDDAWWLTVSAKGYDILLDSLPWGLSLVRLPWMKPLLHVKWR